MRYKQIIIILLLFSASLVHADTTWVGGEIQGGVWNLEGSPYVVEDVIILQDGAVLSIEPGVEVLFAGRLSFAVYDGEIHANGTAEDSIKFMPLDFNARYPYWQTIFIGFDCILTLDYCYFTNQWGSDIEQLAITADGAELVQIRNCSFLDTPHGCSGGGIFGLDIEHLEITDCQFRRLPNGIWIENCDDVQISGCGFLTVYDDQYQLYGIYSERIDGNISHCYFNDYRVVMGGEIHLDHCTFHCTSLLFHQVSYILGPGGDDENGDYVTYSCFFPIIDRMFVGYQRDGVPEGLGEVVQTNANGDSTDVFGNLYLDPHLFDPEAYPDGFLQDDSPCIDAGDPDADPDPDGTVADIGPFFFPQRNIQVDPRVIEFVTDGCSGDTVITIANIGLRDLRVSSVELLADEDAPFFIDAAIEDSVFTPGDSVQVTVSFIPDVQGNYDAVLRIISDDRDEDTLTVNITGESLSISDNTLHPSAFSLSAHPNPFNSTTTIKYSLDRETRISIKVFDLQGREVATLFDGMRSSGSYRQVFGADNLASGVYFCRIKDASSRQHIRKLVLVR